MTLVVDDLAKTQVVYETMRQRMVSLSTVGLCILSMGAWVTGCALGGGEGGGGSGLPIPVATASPIYVSTNGNDMASGNTPEEAVASIAVAIERAQACADPGCLVWIAAGEYVGQVELANGIDLIGGYDEAFDVQDPSTNVTVITSDEPRTVIADGIDDPPTLTGITFRGADFDTTDPDDAGVGRSSYALWLRDADIDLHDCIIDAGPGGDGIDGADGEQTPCDALGGQGGESYDCGGSAGGAADAGGDEVVGGEGGPPGSSNCPNACPLVGSDGVSAGTAGSDGGDGQPGADGASTTDDMGSFDSNGMWIGAAGSAGERGTHGTGGGGGGSGGSKHFAACINCASLLPGGRGGDGAVGGCGGDAGAAGGAGGGSFGIALISSNVSVTNVVINTAQGGDGGTAGAGHAGQTGGTEVGNGREDAASQTCSGFGIDYYSGPGAPGGFGGDGGDGGNGSGGVGGVSLGIALIGSSSVDDGSLIINVTEGGRGGTGQTTETTGIDGRASAQLLF